MAELKKEENYRGEPRYCLHLSNGFAFMTKAPTVWAVDIGKYVDYPGDWTEKQALMTFLGAVRDQLQQDLAYLEQRLVALDRQDATCEVWLGEEFLGNIVIIQEDWVEDNWRTAAFNAARRVFGGQHPGRNFHVVEKSHVMGGKAVKEVVDKLEALVEMGFITEWELLRKADNYRSQGDFYVRFQSKGIWYGGRSTSFEGAFVDAMGYYKRGGDGP